MLWYDIEKKKPIATETGCWDGKRSDKVLVCTRSGKLHLAVMYKGFLDGHEFCNFYDDRDWEIDHVKFWTKIDSPI